MNREIKFRAWLRELDDMIPHRQIIAPYITEPTACIKGKVVYTTMLRYYESSSLGGWENEPIEDVILMQYTGLKDKNGVEIYEGDIVETEYGAKGIVKWYQESMAFRFDCNEPMWRHPLNGMAGEKEVIGNIYENPELLK